jgi:hypothetical protein
LLDYCLDFGVKLSLQSSKLDGRTLSEWYIKYDKSLASKLNNWQKIEVNSDDLEPCLLIGMKPPPLKKKRRKSSPEQCFGVGWVEQPGFPSYSGPSATKQKTKT